MVLARAPADIEPGQVADRERPHGEAEFGEHGVDLPGRSAFQQQQVRLAEIAAQHAVADEAVTDADHHAGLAHGLGEAQGGGQGLLVGR